MGKEILRWPCTDEIVVAGPPMEIKSPNQKIEIGICLILLDSVGNLNRMFPSRNLEGDTHLLIFLPRGGREIAAFHSATEYSTKRPMSYVVISWEIENVPYRL